METLGDYMREKERRKKTESKAANYCLVWFIAYDDLLKEEERIISISPKLNSTCL
jgi:hypothetical protein